MDPNWLAANQQCLSLALEALRQQIERHIATPENQSLAEEEQTGRDLEQLAGRMPWPPALDAVCAAFSLSPFERDLLLLCAGIELDASFASLCAAAQGNAARAFPTFSLALAALPGAHWSALHPDAALRRWRLIEVATSAEQLTTASLRIDERVLHFLTGMPGIDERLRCLIEPLSDPLQVTPSHEAVAAKIAELWRISSRQAALPVVQLCGRAEKSIVAAAGARAAGIRLYKIHAADVPPAARDRDVLARLWEREALLTNGGLLIDADDLDGNENSRWIAAFAEAIAGPVIISARDPLRLATRLALRVDVTTPSAVELHALWQATLGPAAEQINGELDNVLAHFDLGTRGIHAVCSEVAVRGQTATAVTIWDACRAQSRPRIGTFAQRIESAATWSDIVLPEPQLQTMHEIALHVRQRGRVYDTWGFAAKSPRGLGITALFAGPSGTGKTMAAEVIANELRLDLYRIDLSQVVSKYIGETEKNLRHVFEAAEGSGAVLLFDEADALFGKRTEIKDSHDRYANIEISYLLQQMEAYRGLAILTTNRKNALDGAFLRRIRFIVQFPLPGVSDRAEIWRRIFPAETPTDNLELDKLARLNIAGGNIRNIALNAAFLAAGAEEPVRMNHLLRAAHAEYHKIGQPLTDAEIGEWK